MFRFQQTPSDYTACLLAMLIGTGWAASATAQPYPNKPIRLIVNTAAGGGTDILARVIGPKLHESWGQQIVVDNRSSGGGTVAGIIVASALPDGYTLLMTSSAFAGSAALYAKLPFDSVRDFAGVALISSSPQVIVVAPGLNVRNLKELIALMKQKPRQVNFGSAGIGSGTHYAAELFNYTAGISAVQVPYKGAADGLNEVISGRIQYFVPPILAALPLVRSGKLLALAVTTVQRMPMLPDVPTVGEAALPGFEYYGWYGVLAPAKTPREVITRLNKEVNRIVETAEIRDRIATLGGLPKTGTPEVFEKLIRDEIVARRKIFSAAGTKAE